MNWSVLCNRSDRRNTDGTVEWSGRPLWAASARRPKIGTSSFNPEPPATGNGANASLTEATTCGVFLRCMRSKDGTEGTVTLVACPGTVARRRWLRVQRKGGSWQIVARHRSQKRPAKECPEALQVNSKRPGNILFCKCGPTRADSMCIIAYFLRTKSSPQRFFPKFLKDHYSVRLQAHPDFGKPVYDLPQSRSTAAICCLVRIQIFRF